MSRSKPKKKEELPQITKYFNEQKLDESITKLQEEKVKYMALKQENITLHEEIKSREQDLIKSTRAYKYELDEITKAINKLEKENSLYKSQIESVQQDTEQKFNTKLESVKEDFDEKFQRVLDELNAERDRSNILKEENKELNLQLLNLKNEKERLNFSLIQTIQKYEKDIADMKDDYEKRISDYALREETYLKEKENLTENEVYQVYKDLKSKFDRNLKDLAEYKEKSENLNDENKTFRMTIETNDNILKECAEMQVQKQKIIDRFKVTLEAQSKQLAINQEERTKHINDIQAKFKSIIADRNNEVKNYKKTLSTQIEENRKLRALSQMIIDQRSEVEQFFIESLEEVKIEMFKRKKEEERKKNMFPSLRKKYQERIHSEKVDIKDLTPEEKEKVLRSLFSKINQNFKPKSYKDVQDRIIKGTNHNLDGGNEINEEEKHLYD